MGLQTPPKPPYLQNANGEGIETLEKKYLLDTVPNYRPPSKPPYILNVNGEVIGIMEKEDLPNVVPKPKPPPKGL